MPECPHCGGFILVSLSAGKEYTSRHEFKGTEAANLTQTYPRKPSLALSPVKERLAQSGVFGVLAGSILWLPWPLLGLEKPGLAWPTWVCACTLAYWSRRDGKPQKQLSKRRKQTVKLEISEVDTGTIRFLDLECDREALEALARTWFEKETTALSKLVGLGKPFSRPEYENVRDALIKYSYAVWNSRRTRHRGWKPTARGEALFARILSGNSLPRRSVTE